MRNHGRLFAVLMMCMCAALTDEGDVRAQSHAANAVHPRFDLSHPNTGPFPSDRFTVADSAQLTGRRVALPVPDDCVAFRSDCEDIVQLNRLDGFHQSPRVSIPFDGPIDPASVDSGSVFLLRLGRDTGLVVGINQIVWDPATLTLHARSNEALDEHAPYALVVTRRVRDAGGRPIGPSRDFQQYRSRAVCWTLDDCWYRRQLHDAELALRRVGVPRGQIAALSVFHTQSSTALARRLRRQVFSAPAPPPADFGIAPGGAAAVFPFDSIASVTFNRQITTGPTLSPVAANLVPLRFVPGAVGRVALGRYESPDYMVHPGEYIPEVPTRTGPAPLGTNTIYFNLYLPAGPMPAAGWPVAIAGHGSNQHKNFNVDSSTSILPSRGVAIIAINMVGHGFGPLSTLTIARTDGSSVTVPAGGRGFDQNGDGTIGADEGRAAIGSRVMKVQSDAYLQTAVDLMQLVRVIEAGIDVDDDGRRDVDASRISFYGHSAGTIPGMALFAVTPQVRAAVLSAPGTRLLEARSLSPAGRPSIGAQLAARVPSLLNSSDGITVIDGVPVMPGPTFNENQPLRDLPPVVNGVAGAMAIQEVFERAAWLSRFGDAEAFAQLIRRRRAAGRDDRPLLLQFARGDQAASNPSTSALIRAGGFDDHAVLYRHDLFYPTAPAEFQSLPVFKMAHAFVVALPQVPWQPIVAGAQEQIAAFLASDGTVVTTPSPSVYWEVPATAPLPETLGYIP